MANPNIPKDIRYLGKDFNTFKDNLTDFAKTYYPTTYSDFTTAGVGQMFMEMSSYVGDVLSYYLDTQIQENFILFTKEKENLINLAYFLGYTPKLSSAAVVTPFVPLKYETATFFPISAGTFSFKSAASSLVASVPITI